MPKVFAIVPAAGQGTRIGDAVPKQYLPDRRQADDVPLDRGARRGAAHRVRVRRALAARPPLGRARLERLSRQDRADLRRRRAPRRDACATRSTHLGAAPAPRTTGSWCTTPRAPASRKELVEQFLDEVGDDPVGRPARDAARRHAEARRREPARRRRPSRALNLWRAQTPQMFRDELLRRGLEARPDATDESQAVEAGRLQRAAPRAGREQQHQGHLRRGPRARRDDPRSARARVPL